MFFLPVGVGNCQLHPLGCISSKTHQKHSLGRYADFPSIYPYFGPRNSRALNQTALNHRALQRKTLLPCPCCLNINRPHPPQNQ